MDDFPGFRAIWKSRLKQGPNFITGCFAIPLTLLALFLMPIYCLFALGIDFIAVVLGVAPRGHVFVKLGGRSVAQLTSILILTLLTSNTK